MSSPPSRGHTLQCDICDASFSTELDLFDHNLTWDHRVQVEGTKDRSQQVSPPIHANKTQSTCSRRSRQRRRKRHRAHCSQPPKQAPSAVGPSLPPPFPSQALEQDCPYRDPQLEYVRCMSHPHSGPPPPPRQECVNGRPPSLKAGYSPHHGYASRRHSSSSSGDSYESANVMKGVRQEDPKSFPKRRRIDNFVTSSHAHRPSTPLRSPGKPHKNQEKEAALLTHPALQPPERSDGKRSRDDDLGGTHSKSVREVLAWRQDVSRDGVTVCGASDVDAPTGKEEVSSLTTAHTPDKLDDPQMSSSTRPSRRTSDESEPRNVGNVTPSQSHRISDSLAATRSSHGSVTRQSIATKQLSNSVGSTSKPQGSASQLPTHSAHQQTHTAKANSPNSKKSMAKSSPKRAKARKSMKILPGGKLPAVPLINIEPLSPLLNSDQSHRPSTLLPDAQSAVRNTNTTTAAASSPAATAQSMKFTVLHYLTRSLISNGTSPPFTQARTLTLASPPIVNSLLSPSTLMRLSGVSLLGLSGESTSAVTVPSNSLPCNTGTNTSDQTSSRSTNIPSSKTTIITSSPTAKNTTNSTTVPPTARDQIIPPRARDQIIPPRARDGSGQSQEVKSSSETGIKTEKEDLGSDPPHMELPPTVPPVSIAPSAQATPPITTVCDSRRRPVLFGDIRHLDFSLSIKQEDLSSPQTPSSMNSPSNSCSSPRQPESLSSPHISEHHHQGTDSFNFPVGQGSTTVNSKERTQLNKQDIGLKRALSNDNEEGATSFSKKAKRKDTDGNSSSGDFLSQLKALNEEEKQTQAELFAVKRAVSEMAALREEQEAQHAVLKRERETGEKKCGELRAKLEQLQAELNTTLEAVQVTSSALAERESGLRESEGQLSELTSKEESLRQSLTGILKRKVELYSSPNTPAPSADSDRADRVAPTEAPPTSSDDHDTSTPRENIAKLPSDMTMPKLNITNSPNQVATPCEGDSPLPSPSDSLSLTPTSVPASTSSETTITVEMGKSCDPVDSMSRPTSTAVTPLCLSGRGTDSEGNGGTKGGGVVFTPHKQAVLCLRGHGHYLFSGSSDSCVSVHNSETGELVHRLASHERAVNSITVYEHKATLYLLTGSSDKHVHMYNVKRWKQVARFSVGESVMGVVVVGDLLFIALLTGSVKVVDLSEKKQLLGAQRCHNSRISQLCVHKHFLITGSFDNSVCVWDTRDAIANQSKFILVKNISLPHTPLCVKVDSQYLFVSCGDGNVHVYSTEDWNSVRTLPHCKPVSCVDIMGHVLITGCFDKLIRCYDTKTFELLQVYCFESRIFSVCALNSKINVGLESGSLKAFTLDLVNFHTCKWTDCGLKFGVISDLTTYHLNEHVDPKEKLPLACKWEGCQQAVNPSELLAHLKNHVLSQVS